MARDTGNEGNVPATEDIPACQSCRRRKLKCSRDLPSCSQCQRLAFDCIYVSKQKPGIKTGAIDGLSRRLEVLENMLLDEDGKRRPQLAFLDLDPSPLNDGHSSGPQSQMQAPELNSHSYAKDWISDRSLRVDGSATPPHQENGTNRKRRRVIDENSHTEDEVPPLPPSHVVDMIIDMHFQTVHHWVPILHQARFRAKVQDPRERDRLAVLLHSIIAVTMKYIEFEEVGLRPQDVERQIKVSRRAVLLHAMQYPNVESMQALTFLAFDYMGSGNFSRAWPIIGSLTRTVEYFQLTVEPADRSSHKHLLLRPITLLSVPRDWTESEEQRRLFWNVFLLDRVCSVTSGWHTSLTSDHVHRRLPCGGAPWAREEVVSTPFFGIWTKSTAKIGQSIANVPALYEPSSSNKHNPSRGVSGGAGGGDQLDTSSLGAFAYCIEATENLSQVTSFFLQQSIDFGDTEEVKNWLTRFKELDLRLVHWKMFLPRQWRDSDVSRDVSVVKMDPNLTLAHLTHNAATILIHQHVAYPPTTWRGVVKLPSACSAETCLLAAVETASIIDKYLCHMGGIVNSQFAFCAFVAARVLLVHSLSVSNSVSETGNPLSKEFFSLMNSLNGMSHRWIGVYSSNKARIMSNNDGDSLRCPSCPDLMTQYATQLRQMQSRYTSGVSPGSSVGDILLNASLCGLLNRQSLCREAGDAFPLDMGLPPSLDSGPEVMVTSGLSHFNYSTGSGLGQATAGLTPPNTYGPRIMSNVINSPRSQHQLCDTRSGLYYESNAPATGTQRTMYVSPSSTRDLAGLGFVDMERDKGSIGAIGYGEEEDELTAMSHILLGQQFLEMDRVITFDGTDFFGSYQYGDGDGATS